MTRKRVRIDPAAKPVDALRRATATMRSSSSTILTSIRAVGLLVGGAFVVFASRPISAKRWGMSGHALDKQRRATQPIIGPQASAAARLGHDVIGKLLRVVSA